MKLWHVPLRAAAGLALVESRRSRRWIPAGPLRPPAAVPGPEDLGGASMQKPSLRRCQHSG